MSGTVSVTPLGVDQISEDHVIIGVMGPTGTGKSSFIDIATQQGDISVGHSLKSWTAEVRAIEYRHPSYPNPIVFVDTPGFDDTTKSDSDILKMIADWLKKTYSQRRLLAGILYFHRILDPRMGGTPLRNLNLFKELCGENACPNIILTTTMWGRMPPGMDEMREHDLHHNYWKPMLERGSKTARFLDTYDSAWAAVQPLASRGRTEERKALLIQEELVDRRMHITQTAAGTKLYASLQTLLAQQKETSRRLRDQDDPGLQEELDKVAKAVHETISELKAMRIPLGRRLLTMFALKQKPKGRKERKKR